MAEIPGGCLCCVNGLPFQVGLARLLRKARPDRLLIEPSGLGHPAELLRQLRQPPWQRVLAVQPSVLVLDAAALHRGERCPTASGKPARCRPVAAEQERGARRSKPPAVRQLPERPLYWTTQGQLPIDRLPDRRTRQRIRATDQPAEWGACAEPGLARYEQGDLPVQATPRLEHRLALAPEPALDLDRIAQWLAQWGSAPSW